MKKAGIIQAAVAAALGITLSAYAISAFAAESAPQASSAAAAAPAKATQTSAPADAAHSVDPPEWKFFDQWCGKCHNSTDWAGGVAFDVMQPDTMYDDAKVWEEAVKKLRGRLMPPPDKPQPTQQEIDTQVAW